MTRIRRPLVAPLLLGAVALACATVAAFLEQPVWAALLGAALVVLYWGLEALAWRRARTGSFNHAVAAALGGAVLRMASVLVCLVLVGVFAPAAFPVVAIAFVVSFTVYLGVRLFAFGFEPDHPSGAPPR
ncbi:MAG TPA: hypothetical protein VFH93_05195 [Thermoleophilia bacterium]|jgi:hypothetical protein|nr:hypothetical protein [Thermoleophilia bacterium]